MLGAARSKEPQDAQNAQGEAHEPHTEDETIAPHRQDAQGETNGRNMKGVNHMKGARSQRRTKGERNANHIQDESHMMAGANAMDTANSHRELDAGHTMGATDTIRLMFGDHMKGARTLRHMMVAASANRRFALACRF